MSLSPYEQRPFNKVAYSPELNITKRRNKYVVSFRFELVSKLEDLGITKINSYITLIPLKLNLLDSSLVRYHNNHTCYQKTIHVPLDSKEILSSSFEDGVLTLELSR
jgi:hypothetical protein